MPIVRKCCGLDLKKTGIWRAIALIAGVLALAAGIWFAAHVLVYSNLECSHSNAGKMVKFLDFMTDLFNSFNVNTNNSIVKILCGNFMSIFLKYSYQHNNSSNNRTTKSVDRLKSKNSMKIF